MGRYDFISFSSVGLQYALLYKDKKVLGWGQFIHLGLNIVIFSYSIYILKCIYTWSKTDSISYSRPNKRICFFISKLSTNISINRIFTFHDSSSTQQTLNAQIANISVRLVLLLYTKIQACIFGFRKTSESQPLANLNYYFSNFNRNNEPISC